MTKAYATMPATPTEFLRLSSPTTSALDGGRGMFISVGGTSGNSVAIAVPFPWYPFVASVAGVSSRRTRTAQHNTAVDFLVFVDMPHRKMEEALQSLTVSSLIALYGTGGRRYAFWRNGQTWHGGMACDG